VTNIERVAKLYNEHYNKIEA